jgi:hypothetical protein
LANQFLDVLASLTLHRCRKAVLLGDVAALELRRDRRRSPVSVNHVERSSDSTFGAAI